MKMISERFDLRKYKDTCNVNGCNEKPERQVDLVEVKAKGILQKRGLVTLYLCKKHLKSLGLVVRDISKFTDKGIVIRVEEKKIIPEEARYVTF